MDAAALERYLRGAIHGGKLELDPNQLGLGSWWEFIGEAVQGNQIVLDNCRISDEPEFTLIGTTTAFGNGTTQLQLGFADSEPELRVTTDLSLSREHDLSLPGLKWLSIKNIDVHTVVKGSQESGWVTGKAHVGEMTLPVRLEIPKCDDSWIFSIACQNEPISMDLANAVLGRGLDFLPAGLNSAIENLALFGLDVNFNPKNNVVTWVRLSTRLTVDKNWQLTPGWLKVRDLSLHVGMRPSRNGGHPGIGAVIVARANLGTKTEVEVRVVLGDAGWSVQFGASRISLPSLSDVADLIGGQDLRSILPDAFANTGAELRDLVMGYDFDARNLTEARFDLVVAPEHGIHLVPHFTLLQPTLSVTATPSAAGKMKVAVQIESHFSIGTVEGYVRGAVKGKEQWTFKGTLTHVDLEQLVADVVETFGMPHVALPAMVPKLVFDEVSVAVTPATGAFEFRGEMHGKWDLLQDGAGFHLDRAAFRLAREKNGDTPSYLFSIEVSADNGERAEPIVAGVLAKRFHVEFSHGKHHKDNKDGWTAGGELVIDLFEAKDIRLGAMYTHGEMSSALVLSKHHAENADERNKLLLRSLRGEADLDVLAFTDKATLKVRDVNFILAREVTPDGNEGLTTFMFDAGARLTVLDKLDLEGRLQCGKLGALPEHLLRAQADKKEMEEKGLEFVLRAQKPLEIRAPSILVGTDAAPPTLSIHEASIKFAQQGNGPWTLAGGTQVSFESFPERVQQVLPSGTIEGTISVDAASVKFSVSKVIEDVPIDLPALPLSGAQLHDLKVNAYKPTVTVNFGGDITFSLEPTIQLPDNINQVLFGKTKDGLEKHTIFATDAAIAAELAFGLIGGSPGASFALTKLPFAKLEIKEDSELGRYLPCQLGPAGTINIDVPVFKAGANGAFEVGGGFKQDDDDPIGLPLTPFKELLGNHLGGIGKHLPDKILLLHDRPPLFSKGKLFTDKLIETIEKIGKHADQNFKLNPVLRKSIEALGKAASGLPARFIEYLEAGLPHEFHFHATASASGSLTVKLSTGADRERHGEKDPKPLRVLFPSVPNLMGLTIYSLSFGPVFGGALFMLKLDADIDVFDVAAIGGAVAAAESDAMQKLLPNAKEARETIVINNLVGFIIYEAVVPIPVPVSFKELGIHSFRPSGLAMEASVTFDPLANGLEQVLTTLRDLYNFAKYKDRPEGELPTKGALELEPKIGKTYLRLPALLGGKSFGAAGAPLLEVDLYEAFANVLNGIKFFSLSDFLRGIPLEHRCGKIDLVFGPVEFISMAWAATTREEFATGLKWGKPSTAPGSGLVGLSQEERNALIALVPPPLPNTDGLVLMLRGKSGVKKLFEFEGEFGMMTAKRSGFATGVRLRTTFVNQLTYELQGIAAVFFNDDDAAETGGAFPASGFTGQAKLSVGDHVILEADAELTTERIYFAGEANLFPGLEKVLELKGDLSAWITAEGFGAKGSAVVKLFGARTEDAFTITHETFELKTSLTLPCDSATLALQITAGTLSPSTFGKMTITGHFDESFSPFVLAEAAIQAEQALHRAVDAKLRWALHGLRRDATKLPWNKEHFITTWEAYIAVYGALKINLTTYETIGAGFRWAISGALALLPSPVSQGIKYLQGGAKTLFDQNLTIDVSGNMDACQGRGIATLHVRGKYAGQPFGPVSFNARLDAKGLARTVAKKIVERVLVV
ncbi:hypothetical protein [Candidatus Nitrospira neomarina]|uniref:Uncharacterized protein n=1 Tax=Candidatus Nitrospira neomarina TaxID=3020899 RepID=A0AA96JYU8_9BACT|nr:hypothetical protein [Candidatus Nitrospira neomarina]WNM60511.1 hypothetical protein PQG83_12140 [Candidatus Nitrospira neomarina]